MKESSLKRKASVWEDLFVFLHKVKRVNDLGVGYLIGRGMDDFSGRRCRKERSLESSP
ncbi:hypothetical protein MLD52_18370 [Puniceicoccaceae bacterium K14]|nr:hypothetical protein [Puniceicoccaceae bacterium K14]